MFTHISDFVSFLCLTVPVTWPDQFWSLYVHSRTSWLIIHRFNWYVHKGLSLPLSHAHTLSGHMHLHTHTHLRILTRTCGISWLSWNCCVCVLHLCFFLGLGHLVSSLLKVRPFLRWIISPKGKTEWKMTIPVLWESLHVLVVFSWNTFDKMYIK